LTFFKTATGSRQISGIHQRDGGHTRIQSLQQGSQQDLVDATQAGHPDAPAKLVEHAHIGNSVAVGQMGKLPPSALLRQQLEQQVNGVNRRQQRQQVDTPQLCGAEMSLTTTRGSVGPSLAKKPIGNKRGELLKQGVGAGGWK
jgi:hypothetical protein